MTQEHKDLLLKDLCGRLPHGVKIEIDLNDGYKLIDELVLVQSDYVVLVSGEDYEIPIERVKPCLFPLSSLTAKQKQELWDMGWSFDGVSIDNESDSDMFEFELVSSDSASYLIDWFNKNHIDYRDMIGDGLAYDATNLNIY